MINERAIERLKERIIDNQDKTVQIFLEQDIEAIETVLNLLQTQQAEIEKKDKESHFIQSELDIANAKIIELNKIIDEMANSFAEEGFYSEHCQTLIDNDICPDDCNKCVKQYFEKKVESEEK